MTTWDPEALRRGRCGAEQTATTADDHLNLVGAHADAHAVWDRLAPVERDGLVAILRTVLAAPDLAVQLLVLADRQQQPAAGGGG
ncbi:hypothetical protein ACWERV_23275 [Streptomyces sp. NPDC004031]